MAFVDTRGQFLESLSHSLPPSISPSATEQLNGNQEERHCTATIEKQQSSSKRTVFSKYQLKTMERRFTEQTFLSKEERAELAAELKLSERQIMIWFQNRRGRLKRRGPADTAYTLEKLKELNCRRPYPFLYGLLSSGQTRNSSAPNHPYQHLTTIKPSTTTVEQTRPSLDHIKLQTTLTSIQELALSQSLSSNKAATPCSLPSYQASYTPNYTNDSQNQGSLLSDKMPPQTQSMYNYPREQFQNQDYNTRFSSSMPQQCYQDAPTMPYFTNSVYHGPTVPGKTTPEASTAHYDQNSFPLDKSFDPNRTTSDSSTPPLQQDLILDKSVSPEQRSSSNHQCETTMNDQNACNDIQIASPTNHSLQENTQFPSISGITRKVSDNPEPANTAHTNTSNHYPNLVFGTDNHTVQRPTGTDNPETHNEQGQQPGVSQPGVLSGTCNINFQKYDSYWACNNYPPFDTTQNYMAQQIPNSYVDTSCGKNYGLTNPYMWWNHPYL